MIYLDNAATSFPKPASVSDAVAQALLNSGNAGRGSHGLATGGQQALREIRALVARFLGIGNPDRLAFTANCTDALNAAIKGWIRPGDRVVTTDLEHNSVLRPLIGLANRAGVRVLRVPVGPSGVVDVASVRDAIGAADTRLFVVTHASNVLGTVQPVADLVQVAHACGVPVLVDAAQTAGEIPIDVASLDIDMLAASGHKSLLGPQGTGVLYVREGIELTPWREGGTGTDSACLEHPSTMPTRLEAGTHNLPGLSGLAAGIRFLDDHGVAAVHGSMLRLVAKLVDALKDDSRFALYGVDDLVNHTVVLSLNVRGVDPSEAGIVLDQEFGIAVRAGLHCAAPTHRCIGTFPEGTVRVSPGFSSTEDDMDALISALRELAAG